LNHLSNASDAELVRCIQNSPTGSPDSQSAIGILYDRHRERIFRYLCMRVSDRHQAEDLTGDVFIRMVANLPGYRDQDLPFQAWLYRIAHNLFVDEYRKQKSVAWVLIDEVDEIPMQEHDPQVSVDKDLIIEDIRQALEQIDPLQREVGILRFLVGMPIKEVAQVLGKTIPAIKAMQFRGLLCLRKLLETA